MADQEVLIHDHDPELKQHNLILHQLVTMPGFLLLAFHMAQVCQR